jgi:predicted dehydrogenase
LPPTPRSTPVGVVVIGAGVMGRFHAETVAGLKQAGAVHDRTPPQRDLEEALSALRVADAIQRSLASGRPVVLS